MKVSLPYATRYVKYSKPVRLTRLSFHLARKVRKKLTDYKHA